MFHLLATIIIGILVMILWTRSRDSAFIAQRYPSVPYGFYRVASIRGAPANELAGLNTLCAVKLAGEDSDNIRYSLQVTGAMQRSLMFENPTPGSKTLTRLIHTDKYQGPRMDLTINRNVLTFVPNGQPEKTFSVTLE